MTKLTTNTFKFKDLGPAFWEPVSPAPLTLDPKLIDLNPQGIDLIGLTQQSLSPNDWTKLHNGQLWINDETPLCSVYSGHQFGHWAGQLGDGRAHILGELSNWELQLKGSGLTPFSRMGDGRAVVRSTIREYLAGEYLHALDIPTTRSLGILISDNPVQRETLEKAAMMIRLAPSFVRFGTIEHFASTGNDNAIEQLCHWLIEYFYPDCSTITELYQEICGRTARLVAQWMAYGFCHGVMNTDNMSLLGLTLDYGPYGFLETYEPGHICNHSDHTGRYSYENQPGISQWNCFALGMALKNHVTKVDREEILGDYYKDEHFKTYWHIMCQRFGLVDTRESCDLISNTLEQIKNKKNLNTFLETWIPDPTLQLENYQAVMASTNPKFIPYNWVAEYVIRAVDEKDYDTLVAVRNVLQTPFDEHPEWEFLRGTAPDWAGDLCVSCSS